MAETDEGRDGAWLLLSSPPFQRTKAFAETYKCDIAIANDAGIGNSLVYTRTVEELARKLGRPLSILTAPLAPTIGLMPGEDGFAIWRQNPYIDRIVNAHELDEAIMPIVNRERDNMAHFGHMIENISYYYGIRPRVLKPSLFLSKEECQWALDTLAALPRPVIALHPHGTTGSPSTSAWYLNNWRELISRLNISASFFEIRLQGVEEKDLGIPWFPTLLRQMFALVWAADLTICFDSSIAHVATAFECPAIVLWDPVRKVPHEERCQAGFSLAALSRWSYPQNHNIVLLGGHDDEILNIVVRRARDRLHSFNT